jgi:hypothetical protein
MPLRPELLAVWFVQVFGVLVMESWGVCGGWDLVP